MNPPSALHGAMGRERKPFSYLPGGLDLSQIKSERMAQRLMRNAMNPGVPETPAHAIQSPPTPSTPVAVPNFSCLPVQVLPPGFSLPANPKSLLRSRSNPNREAKQKPQAPQFMNPQLIPQTRIEQLQNNINKTVPQLPQTNSSGNNRPTSMFEYGYSPNNSTAKTSYGSDGYTTQGLPEMCYDAEYLTVAPKNYETKENKDYSMPAYTQGTVQAKEPIDSFKTDFSPCLLNKNDNETICRLDKTGLPFNDNKDVIQTPQFSESSNTTVDLSIEPISFDQNSEINSLSKSPNMNNTSTLQNTCVDVGEVTKTDFVVKLPETDVNIAVHDPFENKPAEDLSDSNDDQKQVKVIKKQVKKEKKVEETATNIEDQNGNQNGDNEAELVVKLPTKKSGTKVETKVEVMKKSLPDGSIEETTKTTTKTTTDGKTSIKTKTETRIIPKEEQSEEEVEEEDEDVEEEVEEEPQSTVVKQNGHKEVTVQKEESTVTTTAKKVVVVESNDQEEEEEEEVEPVKETKVVAKTAEKQEEKQEESEEAEEEEEEQVVVVKKATTAPAPVVQAEPEHESEHEDEEKEEEEVVVVKKEAVEIKEAELTKKEDEVEEVEEEEEYEEAEEEVKEEVKKPEAKPEPVPETKSKEQDEESEYTEEEIESEHEEPPKPAPAEKQKSEPEPKPEPKDDKPEPKEEKPAEPVQVAQQSEPKVPLREPSIPLEKVEDVEIKPIGQAETLSKTHTENTEFITTAAAPAGSLSTKTEYNRVENIISVNRTTKTLDNTYEQLTQTGIPTMKTYFAPNRERVSTSPQPSKPYQSSYTPEPPKTERRHSLLLERLSTERQMPGSEVYQNNYSSQYSNQSYEQQKQQWSQEPQSEVVNVSNVKPSTISNSQWYQQSRSENILYNNVTPTTAPPASQLWSQKQPQPQYQAPAQPQYQPQAQPQYQPQAQQQYQPSYTQSTQDYSKVSNTYQQNSYPSYTPQPSSWGNNNLSSVDTIPTINVQSNQTYSSHDTQSYQKSSHQYSSSYVPPPWEQDPNYVSPATSSFFQPRTDAPQPPPTTNTFSPNTHPGWTPTLPKTKFSKPPPKAYVPPAPNQSFVKNVNVAEPHPQPGRKTYYSEYERRYITVPESNYVPGENKFQAQPDPSPQYYYDNNDQPAESVEPQWRKELREFTEKTSQTQCQTQQSSVNPPWESEPNYTKTPNVKYNPTPSWSQTLRPQSWRERSFESELVSESQDWAKSNTLGRNRPMSSYVKSAEAPAPERPRGVSVDRFNPNNYSGPILSEHQPVQVQTLTPNNAPHSKGYHNPNVPAYHARASAEPREQPHPQSRVYAPESRASPLQSRSFKYLQWITGTEE